MAEMLLNSSICSVRSARICIVVALVLLAAKSSPAGPVRLWFSVSNTDPYQFSAQQPTSLEPRTVEIDMETGSVGAVHLWGQPQTENPGDYDPNSNPFRQLQNLSLDVVSTGSQIGTMQGFFNNPGEGTVQERFHTVIDSDPNHQLTIIDQGGQPVTYPRNTNGGIEGLFGFTLTLPTVDGGIGPDCGVGGGVCMPNPNSGPAWLLGTIEFDATTVGDTEVRLQIGSAGINHAGEFVPNTSGI
jgi:hypothetical protein